jgi:hypothetical protein
VTTDQTSIAVEGLEHKLAELGGIGYFERILSRPVHTWAYKCHEISLALVRTGVFGPSARVARGTCQGVGGQHSWVSVGGDCYARGSVIVDGTLWSYRPDDVTELLVTTLGEYGHRPHGAGLIMEWGKPVSGDGQPVALTPSQPLSKLARFFVDEMLGPLDRRGWATLASSAPVEDWPAGEIFAAMDDTDELRHLVPIDKLGMLTDRNPEGLYR